MTIPHSPRAIAAATPDAAEHQPIVDAFTDVPQADGERPADKDVDTDDMFVQGGE